MVADKILAAATKYEAHLHCYPAVRASTSVIEPNEGAALGHIHWMCQEIPTIVAEGHLAKAERWLCFVQGVLWMNGWGTIDGFREDNR